MTGYVYLSDNCVLGSSLAYVFAVGICYAGPGGYSSSYSYDGTIPYETSYNDPGCTDVFYTRPRLDDCSNSGNSYVRYTSGNVIDTTFYSSLTGAVAIGYQAGDCSGFIVTVFFAPLNQCLSGDLVTRFGDVYAKIDIDNNILIQQFNTGTNCDPSQVDLVTYNGLKDTCQNGASVITYYSYMVDSNVILRIVPLGTSTPTVAPTVAPTSNPTVSPTSKPTNAPTSIPTLSPTSSPTNAPTFVPTVSPTFNPTNAPTFAPTSNPTFVPTPNPTFVPTPHPTSVPTLKTNAPIPTARPTTAAVGYVYASSSCTIGSSFGSVVAVGPCLVYKESTGSEDYHINEDGNIVVSKYNNPYCNSFVAPIQTIIVPNECSATGYFKYVAGSIDSSFYLHAGLVVEAYGGDGCVGDIQSVVFSPLDTCTQATEVANSKLYVSASVGVDGTTVTVNRYNDTLCAVNEGYLYSNLELNSCTNDIGFVYFYYYVASNVRAYIYNYPTYNPTSKPTFNPTVVPTSNPTFVPTPHPSAWPTVVPSAVPTARPTLAPSAPTHLPTTLVVPYVTIQSALTLFFEDPLSEQIEVSENQAAALTLIIALSQNVSTSQVNITSITTNNNALKVKAETFLLLNGYFANFNEQSIVTYIGKNQNDSVTAISFEKIMSEVKTIYNDEVFFTATSNTFSNPSIVTIIEPVTHHDKKKHLSGGDVAAIVIMTIIGFVLVVGGSWYVYITHYTTVETNTPVPTKEMESSI